MVKADDRGQRTNGGDHTPVKQTLELWNPRALEPFLPTNWEKNNTNHSKLNTGN